MKLMNDYLDEDIKFDEELQNREDDSLKSSASTSSLDSNEDITEEEHPTDKLSMKSLFKSNVKKVINTLKITKPNNNVEKYLSPIKNQDINHALASLSRSFDDDINDIKLVTTAVAAKMDTTVENIDSINGHKIITDMIGIESINTTNNGLDIVPDLETIDSINGHNFVKDLFINDSINTTDNLKQIVDIFNNQDDPEEDAELSDDLSKGDPTNSNGNNSNGNKKKKKKKKKQ